MSKLVEDFIDAEKQEIALKMLRDQKLEREEIAYYFNFSLEQIELPEKEIR